MNNYKINKFQPEVQQNTQQRIKYGFYSAEHAEQSRTVNYLDEKGNIVTVTTISETPDAKDYKWPDKKFVAIVVKYISTNDIMSDYIFS